jgi:hypothetical protein
MFQNDDDILLAPPLEDYFSDVASARSSGPSGPPPKIDDIITGSYTGWVPIIRAGESLAEAEARDEQARNQETEIDSVEVVDGQVASVGESLPPEPKPEIAGYISAPLVGTPDSVTAQAQALDQARKRIAAMRANLQVNLNQVAESFSHPIFTASAEAMAHADQERVTQHLTTSNMQIPIATHQEPEPIYEMPQASRIFTPTETQTQPEPEVQLAPADHSIELMIMRDEIKDLRDRLDASQKLIEELMHRLANLAELALKR